MLTAVHLTATGVIVDKQFLNVTYSPLNISESIRSMLQISERDFFLVMSDFDFGINGMKHLDLSGNYFNEVDKNGYFIYDFSSDIPEKDIYQYHNIK